MVLKVIALIVACGFAGWCLYYFANVMQAKQHSIISNGEATLHSALIIIALGMTAALIALLGC